MSRYSKAGNCRRSRRDAREAEGARLEIVCSANTGTEGSNPSLSATLTGGETVSEEKDENPLRKAESVRRPRLRRGRRSERSERAHSSLSAMHHARCMASPELNVVQGADLEFNMYYVYIFKGLSPYSLPKSSCVFRAIRSPKTLALSLWASSPSLIATAP